MQSSQQITTRTWHHALLGLTREAVRVERQAYRLVEGHSDELVVVWIGTEVRVAGRFGDVTRVWACHDREHAHDTFEARMADGVGWTESSPRQDAA